MLTRASLNQMSVVELYNAYQQITRQCAEAHTKKASEFSLMTKENKIIYLTNVMNTTLCGLSCVIRSVYAPECADIPEVTEFVNKAAEVVSVEVSSTKKLIYNLKGEAKPLVRNCLEAPAMDIFSIGDHVASVLCDGTYKRGFTGIVIDFESITNRVVCINLAKGEGVNNRVRFAYKPSELKILPAEQNAKIHLEPGMEVAFKIHGGKVIVARATHFLEEPGMEHLLMLVDIKTGNCVFCLPTDITQEYLDDIGIASIQITI